MKIIVCVVVHNRFGNIKRWVSCWKQANTKDAELVIIHNHYGDQNEITKFKTYCESEGIKYVPRSGSGFDVGAMQDVFKERLEGFPNDWDYLLWNCDDTFPMSKDFITPFIEKLTESVGISCMQISSSIAPHVRTTGFCIRKKTSLQIKFPADPITTKQHCYLLEHRGGKLTLTNQVREMGLSCVAVSEIKDSPLWDSDHPNKNKRLDRQQEFNQVWGFKNKDKVLFICPIFNMFPQIISSLICQTHQNWELLLIHNGPLNDHVYDIPEDSRIKFIVYPEATGKWGHELRRWALQEIKEERLSDADYVCIQNADNYLTPRFTEYLLNGFKKSHTAVASYCSDTVHSYTNWKVLPAKLEKGFIDCGAVIVKKDVAVEVGWNSLEHSSDWTYFEQIAQRYSWSNFIKVPGCLFVHNVIAFLILISALW